MQIRTAQPEEFHKIGTLMVEVYAALPGFPSPEEQPAYYQLLQQVGDLTLNPGTEILVAVEDPGDIVGAVVYFKDMKVYGSGGTATSEKLAAGFRLLAVDPAHRGKGIGKALTQACIDLARLQGFQKLVIHSTRAMITAWKMYERMGFRRAEDLDFMQGNLQVYGFRYHFS